MFVYDADVPAFLYAKKKKKVEIRFNWYIFCTFAASISIDVLGTMSDWSNEPHSKCGVRATVPGVRIPLFPPAYQHIRSK